MNVAARIKIVLLLLASSLFIFESFFRREFSFFDEFEFALHQTRWTLFVCLEIWCIVFLFLKWSVADLFLVFLLFYSALKAYMGYPELNCSDCLILFSGVIFGKIISLAIGFDLSEMRTYLVGLASLLAFSSFWHLKSFDGSYLGPRWIGLWNNPNDFGVLMGAAFLISVGLFLRDYNPNIKCFDTSGKSEGKDLKNNAFALDWRTLQMGILLIVSAIAASGLLFSYSRGSWLGVAFGLVYFGKVFGKLKWHLVLALMFIFCLAVWFFWNTPRSDPWVFQRLDFNRGSVLHRLEGWKACLEIMLDHPLGVGWNNAVNTYEEDYSAPEGSAAAITTNDFLMLGTQVGIPALFCFIGYVWFRFRKSGHNHQKTVENAEGFSDAEPLGYCDLKTVCRAAVIAFLVELWFDGCLFKIYSGSIFWILLEMGTV